jgi:hypothetical protein
MVNATGYSERQIGTGLKWMEENGWLTTCQRKPKVPKEYGINEKVLESSGIIRFKQQIPSEETSAIIADDRAPLSIYRFKEKEKEQYTGNIATTGIARELPLSGDRDVVSNPGKIGIQYSELDWLYNRYDGIYQPETIRRFYDYVNMFGVKRKTIGSWIRSGCDILDITRALHSAKKQLTEWHVSEPRKYAGMAVKMVQKAIKSGEVA